MAASMVLKCRALLLRFESQISRLIGDAFGSGPQPALALAHPGPYTSDTSNPQTSLESILNDGLVWMGVPRKRRSLERRVSRRMQYKGHYEAATPRTNLRMCTECGHWHETDTICGHCYKQTKEETAKIRYKFRGNDKHLKSEIVFLYKGEEDLRPKYKGKYIVELNRERPNWFTKELLKKASD